MLQAQPTGRLWAVIEGLVNGARRAETKNPRNFADFYALD